MTGCTSVAAGVTRLPLLSNVKVPVTGVEGLVVSVAGMLPE